MPDPADIERAAVPIISAVLGALGTALAVFFRTASDRRKAQTLADSSAVADYRLVFTDMRQVADSLREEGERMRLELRSYVDRVARLEVALEAMEAAHARVEAERDQLRHEVGRLQMALTRASTKGG
jgi:chromosome segregation ATPase